MCWGKKGEYQKHFLVYGRKGKPCTRCGRQPGEASGREGGIVEKVYLAGRGTYYCPNCQK